jgi:tRNA A37 threonylcarbamoyltransferase TsaD
VNMCEIMLSSTLKVPFPFLTLLASGGHCLLVLAEGASLAHSLIRLNYQAWASTSALEQLWMMHPARHLTRFHLKFLCQLDEQVARELGLKGGSHVEQTAKSGDRRKFAFPSVMTDQRTFVRCSWLGLPS